MTKKSKKTRKHQLLVCGDPLQFYNENRTNLVNNPHAFPDVELYAANKPHKPIYAHRAVLASKSPVFAQLFQEQQSVKNSPIKLTIEIVGKKIFAKIFRRQDSYAEGPPVMTPTPTPTQIFHENFCQQFCTEFSYDSILILLHFLYSNCCEMKVKSLVQLMELSICYGMLPLQETCLEFAKAKIEKFVSRTDENSQSPPSAARGVSNPLYLFQTCISSGREEMIRLGLDKLLKSLSADHFDNSTALAQVSVEALQIILSANDLNIDEVVLAKIFANWKMLTGGGPVSITNATPIPFITQLPGSNNSSLVTTPSLESNPRMNGGTFSVASFLRLHLLTNDELKKLQEDYGHAIPGRCFERAWRILSNPASFRLQKRVGTTVRGHFDQFSSK